ncbi:MAG: hypothetical protein U5Q44_08500 [Dehalococcoidia bacterium]|nr:hypothetical protein [Dehalococcoidia bacterium]
MPMYEFLPLVIAAGGIWWSTVRGNTFSRFLVFWIAGTWLTLSWAGEKMPWLNTHIALPTALLAAWTIQRAWNAWSPKPGIDRALVLRLVAITAVAAAGLLLAVFLPGGPALIGVRWACVLFAAGAVAFLARPFGRSAVPAVLAVAVIGALSVFSVRTMVMVVYERGDVPKDLLIYTQSSPEIPRIANDIDQLARANGKGFEMPIAVDSSDSFSWPWAWYLRDYRSVNYTDFSNGVPEGNYDVMLVSASNADAVNDHLAGLGEARYASPEQYPHRWWFPERYKQAMAIEGADGACTASGGQCGPFEPWLNIGNGLHLGPPNFDMISRLGEGIASDGWLGTWFSYWRNHDPGVPPGSIDAYAYFPAGFDRETGMLSVQPAEPPAPEEDPEGRPSFGGSGVEPGRFFAPTDIDMGPDGRLYVIDHSTRRLQVFDAEGNYIDGVDVRGDEDAQSEPWGVHVAPDGTVIVADTFGWQVRRFSPDLEPIDTIGQAPDGEGETGPYELFGPRDAIVDDGGNLWVTDTGHDRIQVYNAEGEFVRTIGESGSGPGQFDEPVGLAIADDGTVLVADMLNSRVQLLSQDGEPTGEFSVDGWGGNDVERQALPGRAGRRPRCPFPAVNQRGAHLHARGHTRSHDHGWQRTASAAIRDCGYRQWYDLDCRRREQPGAPLRNPLTPPGSPSTPLLRSFRFWLGVAISVVFIALFLRATHPSEIADAFGEANYWYMIPAVGVLFVALTGAVHPLVHPHAARRVNRAAAALLLRHHRLHGEQPAPGPRRRGRPCSRPWRARERLPRGHPRHHRRRTPLRWQHARPAVARFGRIRRPQRWRPAAHRAGIGCPVRSLRSSSSTSLRCPRRAPADSMHQPGALPAQQARGKAAEIADNLVLSLRSVHDVRTLATVVVLSAMAWTVEAGAYAIIGLRLRPRRELRALLPAARRCQPAPSSFPRSSVVPVHSSGPPSSCSWARVSRPGSPPRMPSLPTPSSSFRRPSWA